MIWESRYWKKPLLEIADRLRQCKIKADLKNEQLAEIERDIILGFYSVRKLIETITQVTDDTKSMQIKLGWYPNQNHVNWLNNHKLHQLYDLSLLTTETRNIIFVCGRIIHSFIFTTVMDEVGLTGVLFTSDTDKQKKLYSLKIDTIIQIFEQVSADDPTQIAWQKDPETGEVKTIIT